MNVTAAPEPRDIIWGNIYVSESANRMKKMLANLFCYLLIATYAIPVTLITLVVSDSALLSYSPRLRQVAASSSLVTSLISMVQPICIVTLQQFMPSFFASIAIIEGRLSFCQVHRSAFSRYFSFLIINIFLVSSVFS